MSLSFRVPEVQDNPDGWGPTTVPEHLKDMPFAPFSKGDKIGRASDWTQTGYNKYQGRGYGQGAATAVFQFFHNEEEDSFHLVDNRPQKTPKYGHRRFQHNKFQQRRDRNDNKGGDDMKKKQQHQKKNPWQWQGREQQRQTAYSCSVDIRPEWAVKEQIQFQALAKLMMSVSDPEDLVTCGELEYYDKYYDRITVKAEKPLERTNRAFRNVTTSNDPIINRLAAEGKGRIFTTDTILTTLMCIKSSVYSWDVIVTKKGDQLFFDLRDSSNLNLVTVHETAPEVVPEDSDNMNGVQQLSLEATMINQNFSQQVLLKGGPKYKLQEPNPFVSEEREELASCGYKYRKWVLNPEEDLSIVVRCELDGVIQKEGEDQLCSIKAMSEFDLKASDWRKKLESQRGAVLAFETKNNKNKMAKWTAAAILAGAENIKLGYVSRVSPRDNSRHVILGTQVCKPKDFATQINLNMDHCWGIVRALVELVMKMDDGKYLLVKDPNKELLRLYAIPEDAFDNNYVDEVLPEPEDVPTELIAPSKQEEVADEY